MKLIGELKKQVESTATKEEAKDVIANAGMELTNEELDDVVGGSTPYNFIKEAFDKLSEEEREKIKNKDYEHIAPRLLRTPFN